MSPNFITLLTKQFAAIGQEFSEDFIKQPDWYRKFTWTSEQEEEFGKWFREFIKKNWSGVLKRRPNNKKDLMRAWNEWMLCYAWMTKD
jgi:hypothetical protein